MSKKTELSLPGFSHENFFKENRKYLETHKLVKSREVYFESVGFDILFVFYSKIQYTAGIKLTERLTYNHSSNIDLVSFNFL